MGDIEVGQAFVALAGPVGANKHDFTDAINEIIRTPKIKFSAYLKDVAQRNGVENPSYGTLQDLGMDVIAEQGWPGFCSSVLRKVGDLSNTILIDGLRHALAFKHLQTLSRPRNVFVVYVDVTRDEQIEHLLSHSGVSESDVPHILMHPVEAEATIIKRVADFVIKSTNDVGTVAADLRELLSTKEERDRDSIFTRSGLDVSTFDMLVNDRDRYESLRAVVRLLGSIDTVSVNRWLNTPQYELRRRTPLDALLVGDPEDAIKSAVTFAEI